MSTIDNLHSIDNSICATTAVLFLAVLYVGLALCLIFFLSKPVARLRYAQSLKEKLPHVWTIGVSSTNHINHELQNYNKGELP